MAALQCSPKRVIGRGRCQGGRQRRVFDAPRCADKRVHQGRLQKHRRLNEQHQDEKAVPKGAALTS